MLGPQAWVLSSRVPWSALFWTESSHAPGLCWSHSPSLGVTAPNAHGLHLICCCSVVLSRPGNPTSSHAPSSWHSWKLGLPHRSLLPSNIMSGNQPVSLELEVSQFQCSVLLYYFQWCVPLGLWVLLIQCLRGIFTASVVIDPALLQGHLFICTLDFHMVFSSSSSSSVFCSLKHRLSSWSLRAIYLMYPVYSTCMRPSPCPFSHSYSEVGLCSLGNLTGSKPWPGFELYLLF